MKLTILAPGHFHAALLQKKMYDEVEPEVRIYAPAGPDLDAFLRQVEGYNQRRDQPTGWRLQACTGDDFLERFIANGDADVVVISGNNQHKTEYLALAVGAGVNTLADKPMAIDGAGFAALERAFSTAEQQGVLLYDIMTERHEITTILQKEFAAVPAVFGLLENGSLNDPAVIKESVHHFSKLVSGAPLRRPAWFFDVAQQGEGLVDITTHLVDLVQWECFPDTRIDFRRDIEVLASRRWPTAITLAEFTQVTELDHFPAFLQSSIGPDRTLQVYANGAIDYAIRGVHARVSVRWNFEAPPGGADTHYSVLRGSRANLVIRQGAAESYQPVLTIEPSPAVDAAAFAAALHGALPGLQARYPGIDVAPSNTGWRVIVPATYHVGHEAHFGQVVEEFLRHIQAGALPPWEVPNMLAKYFTTTQALAMARG